VAAIAIAHQRETFTLIDHAGKPLIPAILWLDERARPQVARLSAELGRGTIRDWSGKPPDPTPALYGIAWLAEHQPQALD
ncbi:MAG: xylulose kinase, partial [Mesorhizobium sp.]